MTGITSAPQKGMDSCYDGRGYGLAGLGKAYRPPRRFSHGEWALVATLPAQPDGYEVRVYECRMPATFYRIEAAPTPDCDGRERPGFAFETGTVPGELVAGLARAIANGTLAPAGATLA